MFGGKGVKASRALRHEKRMVADHWWRTDLRNYGEGMDDSKGTSTAVERAI